jgi:Flp pilus assembly pilin Flp
MTEYAVILALVFTVVFVTVAIYGNWVKQLWDGFSSSWS